MSKTTNKNTKETMDQWLAWIAGISSKCKLWFSCPSRLKIHMSATAKSVVLVFPHETLAWMIQGRLPACCSIDIPGWHSVSSITHDVIMAIASQITQFRARWEPTTSYVAHTSSVYLSLSIYMVFIRVYHEMICHYEFQIVKAHHTI